MGIEKMVFVNIVGMLPDLDATLLKCCESNCFHMEPATLHGNETATGLTMLNEKNPYTPILKNLSAICSNMRITPEPVDYSDVSEETLGEFESYVDKISTEFSKLVDERQECVKDVSEKGAAVKQLTHMQGMNANFEQVFNCEHAHVRVGKLPIDSYLKLSYYNETFFFVPFDTDKNFYWGMYFCPKKDKAIVDDIFASLYFERIMVPDFVTGTPEKAFEELNDIINRRSLRIEQLNSEIVKFADENTSYIKKVYAKLNFRNNTFNLRHKVASINEKFYIKGFVPKKESEKFTILFDNIESVSVVIKPPDTDNTVTPPTKLKNSWITRPFSTLVEMYGLPSYNDINPTAFVAITYTLLFGIMFGDLGQGFVIFLIGLFMSLKLKNKMGGILTRVGLSSMFFGFMYGSVFGFEDLLDPVYKAIGLSHKPLEVLEETNFILITAVGIGIALIAVSIILNIITGLRQKNYEKAFFGCNGLAGLVFYGSVVYAVVMTLMFDTKVTSTMYIICLIVIPLICIFCRVPFSIAMKYKRLQLSEDPEESGIGNFIVENIFEMIEFLLSYVSNTMSFLRVGGFVLSHAGMMLVVMTLMNSVASAAQPAIVVIGNLFVMAMEGIIVAIQIIRLEFYEIFSRFYDGNGKPFEPVGVEFDAEVE